MNVIAGKVPIFAQSIAYVSGIPAAFNKAETTDFVPTKTEVPVSTIPLSKLKDCPFVETEETLRTHQASMVTG